MTNTTEFLSTHLQFSQQDGKKLQNYFVYLVLYSKSKINVQESEK